MATDYQSTWSEVKRLTTLLNQQVDLLGDKMRKPYEEGGLDWQTFYMLRGEVLAFDSVSLFQAGHRGTLSSYDSDATHPFAIEQGLSKRVYKYAWPVDAHGNYQFHEGANCPVDEDTKCLCRHWDGEWVLYAKSSQVEWQWGAQNGKESRIVGFITLPTE